MKTLFITPTDAHYYKIIEMLKHFKIIKLVPTCFGSTQEPSSGSSPVLSSHYKYVFSVFVGIDVVNFMAAYEPVLRACG